MNRINMPLDEKIVLHLQDTRQTIRLRSTRAGLPPLLVVQGGPGLSLLNEIDRYEKTLGLESAFTVAYWDQRGCGAARPKYARCVSLYSQEEDLVQVVTWLSERTGQKVLLFGISFGGTLALRAAAYNRSLLRAVIAISPDTDVARSDKAAYQTIVDRARIPHSPIRPVQATSLGPPPYGDTKRFQARLRLLADLGSIEYGKRYGAILMEMLKSLIKTYGVMSLARVLGNMETIQRRLLDELARLNLFSAWPKTKAPIHLVFGAEDALSPPALVEKTRDYLGRNDSLAVLPQAGHMAHFDQPKMILEIIKKAGGMS
jgi:pimeloyl-ACP methyl ester carboxylesterase